MNFLEKTIKLLGKKVEDCRKHSHMKKTMVMGKRKRVVIHRKIKEEYRVIWVKGNMRKEREV